MNERSLYQQALRFIKARRIYFLISIVVLAILLIGCLIQKNRLDSAAAQYTTDLTSFVATVTTDDVAVIKREYTKAPTLKAGSLTFLSGDYRRAQVKQAIVTTNTTYADALSESAQIKDKALRNRMYYMDSNFSFDRFDAGTVFAQKVTVDTITDNAIVNEALNERMTAEIAAAQTYLNDLATQPETHKIYETEAELHKKALQTFISLTKACMAKIKVSPQAAQTIFDTCKKDITKISYDIRMYANFIYNYPEAIGQFTALPVVMQRLEAQLAQSDTIANVERAKMYALTDTRLAIAKTILPKASDDDQSSIRANVIRVLLGQVARAAESSPLQASVASQLAAAKTTLTLYDGPDGEGSTDNAGGFVASLIGAIEYDRSIYTSSKLYEKAYRSNLDKLNKLTVPSYVMDDVASIKKVYEAALPIFKEADGLYKEVDDLSASSKKKSAEGATGGLRDALKSYTVLREAGDKYAEAKEKLKEADELVIALGKKLDTTSELNKSLSTQLDAITAQTRHN